MVLIGISLISNEVDFVLVKKNPGTKTYFLFSDKKPPLWQAVSSLCCSPALGQSQTQYSFSYCGHLGSIG